MMSFLSCRQWNVCPPWWLSSGWLFLLLFAWFFVFRTTVNGLRTTVGRSRLFFRLQVHETTRLRVGETGCCLGPWTTDNRQRRASLTLSRLLVYKTISLQVATAWTQLMLRRLRVHKTTRLQVATARLVVSLTSCLVVWRSKAKLNFRQSAIP